MTEKQQAEIIYKACKENNLDSHIKWIRTKSDVQTWAEKIMWRFFDKKAADTEIPVKTSYMYCEHLDMCFFFTEWGLPCMTYAGYAGLNDSDVAEHKLEQSFRTARRVLETMKRLASEEILKESERDKS